MNWILWNIIMVYVETRLTWLFMQDGCISSSAAVAGKK